MSLYFWLAAMKSERRKKKLKMAGVVSLIFFVNNEQCNYKMLHYFKRVIAY
jgi:hypothetical protein